MNMTKQQIRPFDRKGKSIKVLLISPKSYDERFDQKLTGYRLFPFSIVYLVNYLKKLNLCDVDYIDMVMESPDSLWKMIGSERFDLIGFTSTVEARFTTIDMICKTRSIAPQAKIATGGHFFSKTAHEALQKVPEIDFVLRGEGEITLAELVICLSEGRNDYSSIKGLSHRRHGEIIHNPERPVEPSIDDFIINYDLIYKEGYDFLFPLKNWEDNTSLKAFPLMFARSCNNQCIFCIDRHLAPYRVQKLDNIMTQIDWVKDRFNTDCFMFTDPSFTERKKFVMEFCNRLINDKYNLKWYCEARADIPLDLLVLMRKAGCISIDFALESGSDKVLKALNKKLDISSIHNFASTCNKLGIRASFFSMISMPDEFLEDFEKTFQAIKIFSKYNMRTSLSPLIIFPGTDLERMALEKNILQDNFSWYDKTFCCNYKFISPREYNMPHYREHLSEDEIVECIEMVHSLYKKIWLENFINKTSVRDMLERIFKKITQGRFYPNETERSIIYAYIKNFVHKSIKALKRKDS